MIDDDPTKSNKLGSSSNEIPRRTLDQVYIVDDDSMVRRSLSFTLRTSGFATRAFASGRDFLDEADMLVPGCVLLDIRMPEIDGLGVLDELGKRIRRFPIVVMTGHGDVDTAVRAMKLGARDFLEKPFDDAVLTDILKSLAGSLLTDLAFDAEHRDAVNRMARLSRREQNVLQGLLEGLPNKTIAHSLGISVRTVEMHRGNLMERLGVRSVAEALRIAVSASAGAI